MDWAADADTSIIWRGLEVGLDGECGKEATGRAEWLVEYMIKHLANFLLTHSVAVKEF